MNRPSYTKDERLLLAFYGAEQGEEGCDPISIGESIGLAPKGVRAICKELIRANFLQKRGEDRVILTSHGRSVAKSLQKPV